MTYKSARRTTKQQNWRKKPYDVQPLNLTCQPLSEDSEMEELYDKAEQNVDTEYIYTGFNRVKELL